MSNAHQQKAKEIAKETETGTANTEQPSNRQSLLYDIGQQLIQARQAKRESIDKPVRKLKIPINHLEALESGQWDGLPDDVYVIGFLRQYSIYLDIDLSVEIDRLKNSDYSLTRPLTFPDPPVAPSRRWAWLTGAAFVLLFIIFNVFSANNKHEESMQTNLTPASQQSSMQASTQANEPPLRANATDATQRQEEAIAANEQSAPIAREEENDTAHRITHTRATKTISTVATPAGNSINNSTILNATTANIVAMGAKAVASKAHKHTFRFEAVTAPVWMQIFAANKAGNGKGRLIKEMLLKKGHHANIRRRTESLWITCGNALALRIRVDKKIVVDTGELGAGKRILRDYHFNLQHYTHNTQ